MFQVASVVHEMIKAQDLKANCISEFSHLLKITQLISDRVQKFKNRSALVHSPNS